MKKLTFSILAIISIAFVSCNPTANSKNSADILTPTDSLKIIQEVIQSTDGWANACNTLEVDKIMAYYMDSPELIYINNGNKISGYEQLYKAGSGFYSQPFDSTSLFWIERNIMPVTNKTVHLCGLYKFYFKDSSGNKIQGTTSVSALMIKDEGTWKVLRGQDEDKMINN